MKISEAFDAYKEYSIPRNLSSSTYVTYKYTAKSLISILGDKKIRSLSSDDLYCFTRKRLATRSARTVKGELCCIKRVLKYIKKKGHKLRIDPDDIILPKIKIQEKQFLSEELVEQLAHVAFQSKRGYSNNNRLRNKAIILTLFSSGIRVSELVALNRDSIKDREFTVVGKSKEPRLCFIDERAENSINDYLAVRKDGCKALFVSNQTGSRISTRTVQSMFRRLCKISNFENMHPHIMRHSCATHLLSNGMNIREVADILGHQSLNTTKIYLHNTNPVLKQKYDEIFAKR